LYVRKSAYFLFIKSIRFLCLFASVLDDIVLCYPGQNERDYHLIVLISKEVLYMPQQWADLP